jgi:hypothetical protein
MKASFPTEFDAVLLGKSREAGEFNAGDETVKFGDAYELAFESSDGLTQTARVSLKSLDDSADFDVVKAPKLTAVKVVGDVQVNDRGGYLRVTQVRLAAGAPTAKAA